MRLAPIIAITASILITGVTIGSVRSTTVDPDHPFRAEAMKSARGVNGAATTFSPKMFVYHTEKHVTVCGTLQRNTLDDHRRFAVIFEPTDARSISDMRQTLMIEGSPMWAGQSARYRAVCR